MDGLDWIAVDWGTTSLRIWAMSARDKVIKKIMSRQGMNRLAPDEFEPALIEHIGEWLHAPKTSVIICGMAGAKAGWSEAPYNAVPCAPLGLNLHSVVPSSSRIEVGIIAGLSQIDPADVMRGEETQIAGFLASSPHFEGTICLPGTHTKWVSVSSGAVDRFNTEMTGELFELLTKHSVLKTVTNTDQWDDAAFRQGVLDAQTSSAILSDLFGIRADSLLNHMDAAKGRARLSGLLIGAEVARAQARDVTIIGDAKLSKLYQIALTEIGSSASIIDGNTVTLAGLKAAKDLR